MTGDYEPIVGFSNQKLTDITKCFNTGAAAKFLKDHGKKNQSVHARKDYNSKGYEGIIEAGRRSAHIASVRRTEQTDCSPDPAYDFRVQVKNDGAAIKFLRFLPLARKEEIACERIAS